MPSSAQSHRGQVWTVSAPSCASPRAHGARLVVAAVIKMKQDGHCTAPPRTNENGRAPKQGGLGGAHVAMLYSHLITTEI